MKASFYQCPECQKVFIREGQRHSIKSDCIKCDKARIVCRRVFKWACRCGATEYTSTRAMIPCWCDECRSIKEFKPETATL